MKILHIPSGQYIKVFTEENQITEIIENASKASTFLINNSVEELAWKIISYLSYDYMYTEVRRINNFEQDWKFENSEFQLIETEE